MKKIHVLLGLILLLIAGYFGYRYVKFRNVRFEAMCIIEHELGVMERDEMTVQYVKLINYEAEGNRVDVQLLIDKSAQIYFGIDSLQLEFLSYTTIFQRGWDTIANQLQRGNIALKVKVTGPTTDGEVNFAPERLQRVLKDSVEMSKALELFELRKLIEVRDYAMRHFRNDHYLRLRNISLEPDFVVLTLGFDDSQYQIAPSLRDSNRIANHFIDKVDKMGSIVDNMLQICIRSNRGIAIEYKGDQKGTFHRCEYNVSKTREMADELQQYQIYDNRRVNAVSTGSYSIRK